MRRPGWIVELLETGSVAHSKAGSAAARRVLETLQALDLAQVEGHRSQRRILTLDVDQLARWVDANYPSPDPASETLAPRARNVSEHRNSKAGRTAHDVQPVLLKWFDAAPDSWLSRLTGQHGMVGVTSDHLGEISLPARWNMLTVENWEPFHTLRYVDPAPPIMSVYLGGNVSDVVLTGLADLRPAPGRVLHFGDYDWAGLAIFQRLEAVMPQAELYIVPDADLLFRRYGRRELVEKQPLASLDLRHHKYSAIAECISRHNAGLEQEIVHPPSPEDFE